MSVVAIANQKGGVGKTTTAIQLGYALARLGQQVGLIDMDPQSSATLALGFNPVEIGQGGTMALLRGKGAIMKEVNPNFWLIPSSLELAGMELELSNALEPNRALDVAIKNLPSPPNFLILDLPPSFGRLTINGLFAADEVIPPTSLDYMSLNGLAYLLKTISEIKKSRPALRVPVILPTFYDGRRTHDKDALETLKKRFGALVAEPVKERTDYAKAAAEHRPVNDGEQVYWRQLVEKLWPKVLKGEQDGK